MITPEQIRAARALLDWSTAELARRTGLTVNGLNKIERGHVNAQRDTLDRVQSCFERAGIAFLGENGLRRHDPIVTVYEGADFRRNIIADVYETLKRTGGEYLMAHADETAAIEDLAWDFLQDQLSKRRKAGVTHRFLVREGDKNLIPPYHTYHEVPEAYFAPYPLEIFGGKVGFSTRKYAPKAIVIDDARMTDCVRRLFDFVWDHTEIVPEGKAELRALAQTDRKEKEARRKARKGKGRP
jgi:transcriptional regulator with XRE-family HTH domain